MGTKMGPRTRATSAPCLVMLVLTGCTSNVVPGLEGSATGASESTSATTSSGATSEADGASTTPLGMSETGMPVEPCDDPQAIPPPPVDCSGATGVLEQSVIIEDGGDDPSILEGVVRVEGRRSRR